MRRKSVTRLLFAASIAALVPLGAVHAEPLQSAEVAALIGKQGFEFRGRNTMWKFSPDGKVAADDSVYRATQGGMGESWGMKNTGTWRLAGQQLCILWRNAAGEQCYTITRSSGRMVVLAGPRTIEGTIDAREDTGFAETPPATPAATPPGYRYQRVPGGR